MGVYQIYDGQIANMRQQGSTLREIGETVGVTRERVRQILQERYGGVEILLLPEERVAEVIGCSPEQLKGLRKKGVTSPKHTNWFWLYDRDEIKKAMLALQRSCPHCGKPLPREKLGKYCPECSKESKRYSYPFKSEEAKEKAKQANESWRKEHPERYRKMQRRAMKKYQAKKSQERGSNGRRNKQRGRPRKSEPKLDEVLLL